MRKKKKRIRRVSLGVKKITQYLCDNTIAYKTEFRYKDCRDKLPLPFDFAIMKDDCVWCLIEFQGVQHYKPVRRWKGKKGLVKQQLHDQIKVEYCKTHNLPLLVIHHEDFEKIHEIIETFFGQIA